MKLTHIFQAGIGFRVLETTKRSQTALLTLDPSESSSDKPSRHADSDQVLIVLRGEVTAKIGEEIEVMKNGMPLSCLPKHPTPLPTAVAIARLLSVFMPSQLIRRKRNAIRPATLQASLGLLLI